MSRNHWPLVLNEHLLGRNRFLLNLKLFTILYIMWFSCGLFGLYCRSQKKVLWETTKGGLWSQQLMIPTHGGLYSTKPLLQLVKSLLNPKSYLRLLMLDSWDSSEFRPLVFLQWRILPYCFMTTMRYLKVSHLSLMHHFSHILDADHDNNFSSWTVSQG